MPNATEIKKGMVLQMDGVLWKVLESTHVTPGNWRGMVQVVMKNLATGSKKNHRFRSTDTVETAFLETRNMQYLYKDPAGFCFMDTENYEQEILTDDVVGDAIQYLKENDEAKVTFHEGAALGIELPPVVSLVITETMPGTKGDTVSNVFKPATVETGLVIKVPLFIEQGERVRVDTRTGEFQGRDN
ncbi:MAG: elongation factor P [Planctomycetota bacterium]